MIDPRMNVPTNHWHNAKWCLVIFVGWLVGVIALTALMSRHATYHRDHHNECVVCKPSGKLAMWGECE